MIKKIFIKHVIGFLVGIGIFVIVIPSGLYLLHQSFVWNLFSSSVVDNRLLIGISSFLLFLGLFFVIWSNILLVFKGKGGPTEGLGISISPKTKNLVIKGPYRFTRNPMVFGMLSIYSSIVLFLNSLIGLIVVVVIATVAIIYLKISEERRLLKDFGDEFVQYRQNVSMIVPFPKRLIS
ncbi:MAG: methyltransferase [Candidatus Fermentibacteria bacterium]